MRNGNAILHQENHEFLACRLRDNPNSQSEDLFYRHTASPDQLLTRLYAAKRRIVRRFLACRAVVLGRVSHEIPPVTHKPQRIRKPSSF
nr:hypothetical protein CFP56_43696 [Quercus suber]